MSLDTWHTDTIERVRDLMDYSPEDAVIELARRLGFKTAGLSIVLRGTAWSKYDNTKERSAIERLARNAR